MAEIAFPRTWNWGAAFGGRLSSNPLSWKPGSAPATALFALQNVSLEIIFKALGRQIVFYVFLQSSLRIWKSSHSPASMINTKRQDLYLTRSKVVSRKVLNGLKRKISLPKGFSKRRAAKIFKSRSFSPLNWPITALVVIEEATTYYCRVFTREVYHGYC